MTDPLRDGLRTELEQLRDDGMFAPTPEQIDAAVDSVKPDGFDLTLTGVTPGAITDTLLAIEWFADRVYFDRARSAESAAGWDALAAIVLPLRAALDAR